jgi:hypothetical protein
MRNLLLTLTGLFIANAAVAATLTLDSNTLYGMPGDLVGFGGTITATPDAYDTSTPFLVIDDAEFILNAGTYPVGIFTPIITNNFVVIGPDEGNGEVNPYTQHFDASQGTGIGSYQINTFQSVGDQANGTLVISYSEFSVSPIDQSWNPNDELAGGAVLTLTAPVTVIVGTAPSANSTATPEGSTFALCLLGLGLVYFGRYRAKPLRRSAVRAAKQRDHASAARSSF